MRNPLDPQAWLTEEHRFDIAGETADTRLGVHTTTHWETAVGYAVHKASQEGELPGGEPNCGIILTLDMSGLERLWEADAQIESEHEDVVLDDMRENSEIMIALEEGDEDRLAEAIRDYVEQTSDYDGGYETEGDQETWFSEFWSQHVREAGPWRIVPTLETLAEEDPHDLLHILRLSLEQDGFPLDLWADAISQWRYMAFVGYDRLLAVDVVHPVAPDLVWDEEEMVQEGEGPVVTTMDWLELGSERLWKREVTSAEARKMRVEFHGTDVKRARLAFPELEDVIRCPWPYGQPEGVGPS